MEFLKYIYVFKDMFMPAMPDPPCANTQACLGGIFLGMLLMHNVYSTLNSDYY